MDTMEKTELVGIKVFKHASFSIAKNSKTGVLQATTDYIPIEEFKKIFNFIGEYVKLGKVNKLVFDKRKLSVFHQPSMEWYFVHWKEEMFDHGLRTHRKILPADHVFEQSVKIGREKIDKDYPNGKFHQMDIQYFNTIEEAISK